MLQLMVAFVEEVEFLEWPDFIIDEMMGVIWVGDCIELAMEYFDWKFELVLMLLHVIK